MHHPDPFYSKLCNLAEEAPEFEKRLHVAFADMKVGGRQLDWLASILGGAPPTSASAVAESGRAKSTLHHYQLQLRQAVVRVAIDSAEQSDTVLFDRLFEAGLFGYCSPDLTGFQRGFAKAKLGAEARRRVVECFLSRATRGLLDHRGGTKDVSAIGMGHRDESWTLCLLSGFTLAHSEGLNGLAEAHFRELAKASAKRGLMKNRAFERVVCAAAEDCVGSLLEERLRFIDSHSSLEMLFGIMFSSQSVTFGDVFRNAADPDSMLRRIRERPLMARGPHIVGLATSVRATLDATAQQGFNTRAAAVSKRRHWLDEVLSSVPDGKALESKHLRGLETELVQIGKLIEPLISSMRSGNLPHHVTSEHWLKQLKKLEECGLVSS